LPLATALRRWSFLGGALVDAAFPGALETANSITRAVLSGGPALTTATLTPELGFTAPLATVRFCCGAAGSWVGTAPTAVARGRASSPRALCRSERVIVWP